MGHGLGRRAMGWATGRSHFVVTGMNTASSPGVPVPPPTIIESHQHACLERGLGWVDEGGQVGSPMDLPLQARLFVR